jgi:hypothetical protein
MQLVMMVIVAVGALAVEAESAWAGNGTAADFSAAEVSSARPSPALRRQTRNGTNAQPLPTWARAYSQRQWSATIELIETIPEASRTAWHWLHLARALEKRTRLVESFAAYERLLDVAAESASIPGVKDVERQARAESSLLAPRIPWAEVALDEGLPAGAFVFVDQQWLDPARLRSPYPVNPGWHTFLVESNGEVLAARRTFFEEGQSRLVPLTSFAEPAAQAAHTGAGVGMDGVTGEGRSAAAPERRRSLTWRTESQVVDTDRVSQLRTASYLSFGVGAIAAGVGTLMALDASTNGDHSGFAPAMASYALSFGAIITGGVFWVLHHDAAKATMSLGHVQIEPRFHPSGAAVSATF